MKKVIILLLLMVILYFAFFTKSNLSLGGTWQVNKFILNDKNVLSKNENKKIGFLNDLRANLNSVIIDDWKKTIIFSRNQLDTTIKAEFELKHNNQDKPFLILSSNEKFLNGAFQIEIDTFYDSYKSPKDITINLKIKSKNTFLDLQKTIEPIKIDYSIRKGKP